jgi:hypothetical protein
VRESSIDGAGQGLFAAEDLKGGTFLGEYKGKIQICGSVSEEDESNDKVTRFAVSKSKLSHTFDINSADSFKVVTLKVVQNRA